MNDSSYFPTSELIQVYTRLSAGGCVVVLLVDMLSIVVSFSYFCILSSMHCFISSLNLLLGICNSFVDD